MRVEMQQRSDAVLDPLTGLLNRKALAARFEEIAQQASLAGGSVCLLACDLDHFKQVNDVHGHETGDQRAQGDRLRPCASTCGPSSSSTGWAARSS